MQTRSQKRQALVLEVANNNKRIKKEPMKQDEERVVWDSAWILKEIADKIGIQDIRNMIIQYWLHEKLAFAHLRTLLLRTSENVEVEKVSWCLQNLQAGRFAGPVGPEWYQFIEDALQMCTSVPCLKRISEVPGNRARFETLCQSGFHVDRYASPLYQWDKFEFVTGFSKGISGADRLNLINRMTLTEDPQRLIVLEKMILQMGFTLPEFEQSVGGRSRLLRKLLPLDPSSVESWGQRSRLCDPTGPFRFTTDEFRPVIYSFFRQSPALSRLKLEVMQWACSPIADGGAGMSIHDFVDALNNLLANAKEFLQQHSIEFSAIVWMIRQGHVSVQWARHFCASTLSCDTTLADIGIAFDPQGWIRLDPKSPSLRKILLHRLCYRYMLDELSYFCDPNGWFAFTTEEVRESELLIHVRTSVGLDGVKYLLDPNSPVRLGLVDVFKPYSRYIPKPYGYSGVIRTPTGRESFWERTSLWERTGGFSNGTRAYLMTRFNISTDSNGGFSINLPRSELTPQLEETLMNGTTSDMNDGDESSDEETIAQDKDHVLNDTAAFSTLYNAQCTRLCDVQ